jgi:hypothetical protein
LDTANYLPGLLNVSSKSVMSIKATDCWASFAPF